MTNPYFLILLGVFLFWAVFGILKPFKFAEVLEKRDSSGRPREDFPLVSVIIPARDEENNIRSCLESIAEQDYPNLEVIVVNDRSSDNTARIARTAGSELARFRLISIKENELPEKWIGKNFALFQGTRAASGKWYLFVDADISFSDRTAVTSALMQAEKDKLDLLSLFPKVNYFTFWEKVVNPMAGAVFLSLSPIEKINDPASEVAAAVGGFIMVLADSYRKTGGHETIKHKIVEDLFLARLLKGSGYRMKLMDGSSLYQTRMYSNFKEVWEGWSKNAFPGMDLSFFKIFMVGTVFFLLNVYPFLMLLVWGGKYFLGGGAAYGFYAIFSLAINVVIMYINYSLRLPLDVVPEYALTMPLGGAVMLGILINSALRVGLGWGVSWKGTVYYKKT